MGAPPPGLWFAQLYHHEMPGEEGDETVGAKAADGAAFIATPRLQRPAGPASAAIVMASLPAPASAAITASGASRIGCKSLEPHAARLPMARARTAAVRMDSRTTVGHAAGRRLLRFRVIPAKARERTRSLGAAARPVCGCARVGLPGERGKVSICQCEV